uniref:S41 family peptidase n=1 Tax=Nonomuraea pusilla TaxID=46177 RepID=UPI0007C72E35|nr:S41 family peptidase [Nonomuraea pusilla]
MNRSGTRITVAALAAVASMAAAPAATAAPATAPATAVAGVRDAALDGVWQADGYSTIITVQGDRLRYFDTTAISCQAGVMSAERRAAQGTFVADDGSRQMTIELQGRQRARLRYVGAVGEIGLRRLPALPARCSVKAPAADPVRVFDVFWTTFTENYPFFATKGVDWQAVRERYRPRVGPKTTDAELFGVLRDILKELGDAHTALRAGKDEFARPLRPGTRPLDGLPAFMALNKRVLDLVEKHDVKKPLTTWGRGVIGYADLPGGFGYLRLAAFDGYADGGFAANAAELDRALDEIFTPARASSLKGLVLDVRLNFGGYDALGIQLASRLTGRPYTAYAKQARNDPSDPSRFTRALPIRVRPAAGSRYTGPIALLTSPLTISAGETFSQAMTARTPAPRRIGDATQGAFSDFLWRTLPNGWTFALPNERFLTRQGTSFDVTGIPPQDRIAETLSDEELAAGRDAAFDRALGHLRTAARSGR